MTLIGLELIVLTDRQSETVEGGHRGAQTAVKEIKDLY